MRVDRGFHYHQPDSPVHPFFLSIRPWQYARARSGSTASLVHHVTFRHLSLKDIEHGHVAQLDRASGFEPEGREFESLRGRHRA